MSGVSSRDHRATLGDDLWTLVESVESTLVDITRLTRLPSDRLHRASFRLQFADGRVLKGRRFDSSEQAERVTSLCGVLDRRHFPTVLARHERGVLIEWVDGRALDETQPEPNLHQQIGEMLGALHRVSLPRAVKAGRVLAPDSWERRLRGNLTQLVALNVLSRRDEEAAMRFAMDVAPARSERSLVHGDFCSENIVITDAGHAWIVDNERLSIDAPAYDLARTWYRWSMSPDRRDAFMRGYSRHRSPRDFHDHFLFWAIAVLSEAAVFRVSNATPDMNVPLERLRGLLAGMPNGQSLGSTG